MTLNRSAISVAVVLICLRGLYAQDNLRYRFEYHCKSERVVVDHCRHDSDQPGFAPTKPENDYCQVYYPDRPKSGGFEAMAVVLRNDVIKTLSDCGAFWQESTTTSPSRSNIDESVAEAKAGDDLYEKEDYLHALEHYKKANLLAPSSAVYLYLGATEYKLKQYSDSIEALTNAAQMVPDAKDAYYWRGLDYLALAMANNDPKFDEKAESEFRTVTRISPDYGQGHTYLGEVYYREKKYRECIASMQEALKLDPKDPSSMYLMGFAYVRLGQKDTARKVYQDLATIDKQLADELLAEIRK